MYAVIFRASSAKQDKTYNAMVDTLRTLAFEKYGCLEFVSATEGENEITISYWPDETAINAWKQDVQHILAQKMGRERWYQSYSVQVTEIKREYSFP